MSRLITLALCVTLGLAFLSRSCALTRPGSAIAFRNAKIVGGNIAAVSFYSDETAPATASGAREIDVNGMYVAATTFDRTAPTLIDGIRHVWVGQVGIGDPGDVVIMRNSPGRIRPGYIPDTNSIVGAVVDGVYYTARDLSRSPRTR